MLGQFTCRAATGTVDEVPEPLEFVEDYKVGFERFNACCGERSAQLGGETVNVAP
jgi:hypothetical protein